MPLYLTEGDVQGLLDMRSAITALEEIWRSRAAGGAHNLPRRRISTGSGTYQIMAASWPERGVAGHKSYVTGAAGANFHVALYGTKGEGLLALIEANSLGQIRTGAASGVATRYLARKDAAVLAVIGSGFQAATQIEAVVEVRQVKQIRVFSRSEEKRTAFARDVAGRTGLQVVAAGSAADCVHGADIVTVITNASEPVLLGGMVAPGMHVNAAGAYSWTRRELDADSVSRCGIVAVDDVDQAKTECADIMRAVEAGKASWDTVMQIERIVAGISPGRRSDTDITLFESQGIALEDLAVAELVYRRARERGIGSEFGNPHPV